MVEIGFIASTLPLNGSIIRNPKLIILLPGIKYKQPLASNIAQASV